MKVRIAGRHSIIGTKSLVPTRVPALIAHMKSFVMIIGRGPGPGDLAAAAAGVPWREDGGYGVSRDSQQGPAASQGSTQTCPRLGLSSDAAEDQNGPGTREAAKIRHGQSLRNDLQQSL